jgi:hypothetical protein
MHDTGELLKVVRNYDDNASITYTLVDDNTAHDIPNGTYKETQFYFTTKTNNLVENTPACNIV